MPFSKMNFEFSGFLRRLTQDLELAAASGVVDLRRGWRSYVADLTRPRHVLVIGGAGYIGCVLVDCLLERGYQVRVLDNFLYDHFPAAQGIIGRPGSSVFNGDFRDRRTLDKALDRITDVVLLASVVGDPISRQYPELASAINLRASQELFESLKGRGLDRFVFTSTCSNYGLRRSDEAATEDSQLNPLSIYAETKVAFERHILSELAHVDFSPAILRLATAFGFSPRMRFDLTVNEFCFTAALGKQLSVYDKNTWRPYCHVRDICSAIICVIEAPGELISGQVFNVGSDENNYTKAGIVEEILRYANSEVVFVEGGGDARNYKVSFEKIRDHLGFTCRFSVQAFIPELIQAVRAGLFPRLDGMHSQYGNHRIRAGIAASCS